MIEGCAAFGNRMVSLVPCCVAVAATSRLRAGAGHVSLHADDVVTTSVQFPETSTGSLTGLMSTSRTPWLSAVT